MARVTAEPGVADAEAITALHHRTLARMAATTLLNQVLAGFQRRVSRRPVHQPVFAAGIEKLLPTPGRDLRQPTLVNARLLFPSVSLGEPCT